MVALVILWIMLRVLAAIAPIRYEITTSTPLIIEEVTDANHCRLAISSTKNLGSSMRIAGEISVSWPLL